ncbi:MAG: hypothetical protein CV087_21195 [Candidatus Brocadia sp. WS118]|nr:MAG: hypothetical protein CV087_21195 [Candidatus Brocadia sp. WS118]
MGANDPSKLRTMNVSPLLPGKPKNPLKLKTKSAGEPPSGGGITALIIIIIVTILIIIFTQYGHYFR